MTCNQSNQESFNTSNSYFFYLWNCIWHLLSYIICGYNPPILLHDIAMRGEELRMAFPVTQCWIFVFNGGRNTDFSCWNPIDGPNGPTETMAEESDGSDASGAYEKKLKKKLEIFIQNGHHVHPNHQLITILWTSNGGYGISQWMFTLTTNYYGYGTL